MKLTHAIPRVLVLAAVLICAGILFSPGVCFGQGAYSMWGSSSWFDWSDYRLEIDARIWLPRLMSGSIETQGRTFDLKRDLGFNDDPEPFRELRVEFYVDRLGIRVIVSESQHFQGLYLLAGLQPFGPLVVPSVPELQIGGTRIGVDLDVIRYPTFRFGWDVDYQKDALTFQDTGGGGQLKSKQILTTGVHITGLPGRIRDIPIIIRGRARFPVPYVSNNLLNSTMTDWEVSAGLRPTIWETSLYGLSTFSVVIEAGYRSMNLDFTDTVGPILGKGSAKATLQGAFIQVGFVF